MSRLRRIAFERQSKRVKDRVKKYWKKRAESFYELRHDEIESEKAEQWLEEIDKYIPNGKKLNILDIGCGTGFFEIILGRQGHTITGIDLTPEMVEKGNEMIAAYGLNEESVSIVQMDAEKLTFLDDTFDLVISRNLTWTLPHPTEAYAEWNRVLKPGGMMLNYDAEYAKNAHQNLYSTENRSHDGVSQEMKEECHKIYHMLSISNLSRPQWDREVLKNAGFSKIHIDTTFGDRVYKEKDRFYIPDRMFEIMAQK